MGIWKETQTYPQKMQFTSGLVELWTNLPPVKTGVPFTTQSTRPLRRIKVRDKVYLWHSKIALKTHPPRICRRILTDPPTESVGSCDFKHPAIILNNMGKPRRRKLCLGRSNFEDSSLPPSPKLFDIDQKIIVLLPILDHLGWQFNMRPDVSRNSIKELLIHVLTLVGQIPVRDILCQHANKLCLFSLRPTTNLPFMDIWIQSMPIIQHFVILSIIRSYDNTWNSKQECPSFRPRITQLFIYKILDISTRTYHMCVTYVHSETTRTTSIITIPFGFPHQRWLMFTNEPQLGESPSRNHPIDTTLFPTDLRHIQAELKGNSPNKILVCDMFEMGYNNESNLSIFYEQLK